MRSMAMLRASLLVGAGLCSYCGEAAAQNQPAVAQTTATGQTERVVVTGFLERDLPQQLAQMGTRLDIVSSADIKNGGYLDVAQSLQVTVPGLFVTSKNGPFDYVQVSLQGSRTQDVLWTVDGVRINNRLYAGTSPIDTLPASMIERIEVLEGAQALFYGTQALAGAINIVTKEFSDTPDSQFTIGVNSNSGRHLDGYFRDTIGRTHFVVFASNDEADGFSPYRASDYQPSGKDRNRSFDVTTVGGKIAVDLTEAFRVTLSETHTWAMLDYMYPSGVTSAYNNRSEDILSLKADYKVSNELSFFAKGYYHWWYSYYSEIDTDIGAGGKLPGTTTTSYDRD